MGGRKEGKYGPVYLQNCCNSKIAAILTALCHQVLFFFAPQLSLKDEKYLLLPVVKTHMGESGTTFCHFLLEGVAGGPGQERRGNILINCKTSNSLLLDFFLSHC